MTDKIYFVPNTYAFSGNNFPTCTYDDFVTKLNNKEPTYEVLTKDTVCLYFDIDVTTPSIKKKIAEIIEEKGAEYISQVLNMNFENQYTISVATSHGQARKPDGTTYNKYSVRYWVPEIKINKKTLKKFVERLNQYIISIKDENNHLFEWVGDLFETDKTDKNGNTIYNGLFDESIYDTNRKMRCIWTSKPNETRPLILKTGTIESTIIQNISGATLTFDDEFVSDAKDTRITVSTDNENELKYCDYVSIIDTKYFEEYESWFKFQRASANIGIKFEVYDQFMVGCKGYDHDNNLKHYERPNDSKRGSLGWKHIFELAYASNPLEKSNLDIKWGTDLFCLHQFKRICYKYDPNDKDDAGKKEVNKQIYNEAKEYFEKFHFKVMSPYCFGRKTEKGYDFISKETLHNMYENLFIFSDKGKEKQQFTKMWVADSNIRYYESYDFCPPPIEIGNSTFNLFNGFKHEKILPFQISKEEIAENSKIFIKHLWYLSGKSNDVLFYVLNYLAHILQEAGELPRTSIVFKSAQGVGKNVFFELFGEKILGEQYMLSTPNIDHILGRFPLINQKVLVLMDEANGKDSFIANDKIKNFITAKHINYEKKGVDGVDIKNCGRMIFFTNNEFPVKIEQTDRRFVVVECSNDMRNNTPYFKKLIEAFNNKKMVWSFAQFLLNREIAEWDSVNDRPITQIYKDVQKATIPSNQKFFMEYDSFNYGDQANAEERYSGKTLYEMYINFCRFYSPKPLTAIAEKTFLTRLKDHTDFLEKIKDTKGNYKYIIHEEAHKKYIETKTDNDEDDAECDEFPF